MCFKYTIGKDDNFTEITIKPVEFNGAGALAFYFHESKSVGGAPPSEENEQTNLLGQDASTLQQNSGEISNAIDTDQLVV